MNIFYLDNDPVTAAKYHCNKHVVKMILESAQMLCTIINEARGEQCTPYKSTHKNHPCTLWAGHSLQNALWLYDLTHALNEEYKHRFNHSVDHKSFRMLEDNAIRGYLAYYLEDNGFTEPAQAMPEYLKSDDAVFSYRLYYQLEKADLLQYTNRERPDWL